jgi:hypothetical protein
MDAAKTMSKDASADYKRGVWEAEKAAMDVHAPSPSWRRNPDNFPDVVDGLLESGALNLSPAYHCIGHVRLCIFDIYASAFLSSGTDNASVSLIP